MTPDPMIAAREFINTQRHLLPALRGVSVEARAGYLAAVAMVAGPNVLASLLISEAIALFIEVLSE